MFVLLRFQHALAEVESQWETHFLQGLPVLALSVHLLNTHTHTGKGGVEGRVMRREERYGIGSEGELVRKQGLKRNVRMKVWEEEDEGRRV